MDLDEVDAASFAMMLRHADDGPRERGEMLAEARSVSIVSAARDQVSARVQGTEHYHVVVNAGSGTWSCSCPFAADGSFCKHCVAVVCVVVGGHGSPAVSVGVDAEALSDLERIAAHVKSLPADDLVEIVLDQLTVDRGLADRLLVSALADAGEAIDVGDWKKRITAVFRGRGGFVEWRDAPGWASEVHDMFDVIQSLLGAGYATEVATLAEHAHRRAQSAVGRVDDSGGEILGIIEVVRELHLSASEAGAFAPKVLGRRLAKLETTAELDTFHRSAVSYAEALGSEGLDAFGAEVDAAWEKLPPNADSWGPAFRIRHARIGHAMATRDPDRFVELFAGDGRISPHDHVDLVELLIAADRIDEAADWADRGLADWAGHHQLGPLRDLRAKLLRLSGDPAEVEELYWQAFVGRPTTTAVLELLENANDGEAVRRRLTVTVDSALHDARPAVAGVVAPMHRTQGSSSAPLGEVGAGPVFRKGLVMVPGPAIDAFLALDEVERAWGVAMEFGASRHHWEALAARRGDEHLADAVRWAFVAAEMEIDFKNRQHYRRAVKNLRSVEKRLVSTANTQSQRDLFDSGVQDLLMVHRNKPSLVEEFAKAGWTLL